MLRKGAPATFGYWYDTTVTGVAGTVMTLSCNDGTSGNWYQETITLDGNGNYRDSTLCYSGDANPHWVTSGTLVSNRVDF